jgi:hypothetical protein
MEIPDGRESGKIEEDVAYPTAGQIPVDASCREFYRVRVQSV